MQSHSRTTYLVSYGLGLLSNYIISEYPAVRFCALQTRASLCKSLFHLFKYDNLLSDENSYVYHKV